MTINAADNSPRIEYTVAQGVTQTTFSVPFEFFDTGDLNVYVDGVLKVEGSDYTVTGGEGSTGSIIFVEADPAEVQQVTGATGGSQVVITRDIPIERTTDFNAGSDINRAALNEQLDTIIALIADVDDKASRAIQIPDYEVAPSLSLPDIEDRKGRVLAFDETTGDVAVGPVISEISTLNSITADIARLADIEDGTLATDAIQTVSGISSNVTTVAGVSGNVTTVAGISSDVTAVAADATDIGTVSSNIANVNTVAGISADVSTVAADGTDIGVVAGISSDVTTVSGISANVTTVAGISSDVTTVAGINTSDLASVAAIDSDVATVSGIASNVTTVAGNNANVTTVAGISSDVTAVAADATDIGTVATNLAGTNTIGTVAGSISNVNAVGGSISSVNTVATNIDNVNDFFDVYRTGTSFPTTSLNAGDLFLNTDTGTLYVYSGSGWTAGVTAGSGFMPISGGNFTGNIILYADPTNSLGAATKQYVDTIAAAGLHYHAPVRVETDGSLPATYDNGTSGVGATLTNSGTQEALVIDGVTLSVNDRVLIYARTNAFENGVYYVSDTGSASTNWVLTRTTDTDSYGASDPDALGQGDAFFVLEGETGAGELYVMNTQGEITFGTTGITFTQVAATAVYSAGTGLTLTGTEFAAAQDIATSASPTFAGLTLNGAATSTGDITASNFVTTGNVDGRDVSADGAKLDGIEAGATADQTAAEILTAIKTVDGAGSGLDADTLDGIQASSFLQANQTITLSGDATGSGTTSIVVTVADDSHNHIISNVDGLQTALDGKLNLSGGTVTGTINAATFNATSTTNGGFQGIDADTATTPSFTWSADLNTGIYRPAADTLSVTTAGTRRFTVGPAGQIGVGGANYGTSGQVLTSNGTGSAPSWQAGGGAVSQTFTASGTWTKPSSGTYAFVEVWGGGGGGGSDLTGDGGSGGGGGGYNSELIKLSSLSATVAVTIGAGGAGGTTASYAGGTGGTTTFGSYLKVYGGGGGNNQSWGGGGGGDLSAGATGGSTSPTNGGQGSTRGHDGKTITVSGNQVNTDGYTSGNPNVPRYGGGGGGSGSGSGTTYEAGDSVFGGGGGAGGLDGTAGTTNTKYGVSKYGGRGGTGATAGGAAGNGVQPAGGGGGTEAGNAGNGGAGQCRVTVW